MAVGENGASPIDLLSTDGGADWAPAQLPGSTLPLTAVSCATGTTCVAAGFGSDDAQLLTTNDGGQNWATTLFSHGLGDVSGVSCVSQAFCVEVALDYREDQPDILVTQQGVTTVEPQPEADLQGVDCASLTFCVAVGADSYNSGSSFYEAAATVSTDGGATWTQASLPDVTPGVYGEIEYLYSVSCPTTLDCIAVGSGVGASGSYPAILSTSDGGNTWNVQSAPDVVNYLASVSCFSASDCVAVGGGGVAQQPYATAMFTTDGGSSWTPETVVEAETLDSVSCASATQCVAVGGASVVNSNDGGATWEGAEYTEFDGLQSVSCPTESFCAAVGASAAGIYSLDSPNGGTTWEVDAVPSETSQLYGVSCPTESFCVAGGLGTEGALLLDGSALGTSGVSTVLPRPTTLSVTPDISDPVVGQAIAVGVQVSGPTSAAGPPAPTGQVTVTGGSLTCVAPVSGSNGSATGSCSLIATTPGEFQIDSTYGGDSVFGASNAISLVNVLAATSTTSLSLSQTGVEYGREQRDQVSVVVVPEYPGAVPAGTVTVKTSATTLCSIVLSSGSGSCNLPANRLSAGRHWLVDDYSGLYDEYNGRYYVEPSISPGEALTVSRAISRTVLETSRVRISYGDEERERLSVTVASANPGLKPTGTVAIKDSSRQLCTITLRSGEGSCRLSGKQLKAGIYSLVAAYGGSADFVRSTSGSNTLTVVG
jgi:photosystem II stability/assembly factor-like uncharacterized protein